MIEKIVRSDAAPGSNIKQLCFVMEPAKEHDAVIRNHNDEMARWSFRNKKNNVKKKISLMHLLTVICASRESCLEWLQSKGLIPRIMFCPNCSRKMVCEEHDDAIDGYIWICKDCSVDPPPQFSVRHGSWLESKDAPLVDILLFTYLWAHEFTEDQISKEANMPLSVVQEWSLVYSTICDSLYQRKRAIEGEFGDINSYDVDTESSTKLWQKKNNFRDPFLEFLKDADSL